MSDIRELENVESLAVGEGGYSMPRIQFSQSLCTTCNQVKIGYVMLRRNEIPEHAGLGEVARG